MVGAGVFGFFGYQAAKQEAQTAWEASRFPPELTRDFVFQSYGLSRVKDQKLLQKVHRLIPMSTSEEGVFWLSEEGRWIVLYRDHEDEEVIQVYCKTCKPIPQSWEPSARGWLGFDQVIERLELLKKSKGLGEVKKPRSERAWTDPRELIY